MRRARSVRDRPHAAPRPPAASARPPLPPLHRPAEAPGAPGSRGRRSPRRSRARHIRHEPCAKHRDEQLDRLDAGARVTLCQRVRAQEHRRAHDVVGVWIADATGMASEQPQLELGRLLGRDRLRDEPAEPGVDAVRMVSDLRLEERARRRRPLSATRTQRNVPAPDRDVPDVPDREVVTRELDHGRHGASLVPPRRLSPTRYAQAHRRDPAAPPAWGRDVPRCHVTRDAAPGVCPVRAEMVTAGAGRRARRQRRHTASHARRCHSSTLSSSSRSR